MQLLALSCLFVRMEQLGSKLMTFHENCYLSIFKKSVEEIKVIKNCAIYDIMWKNKTQPDRT